MIAEFDFPKNIYGFSLSKLTARILWRLRPLDMCYQVFPNNLDHYLSMLIHDQPKYILGMGTYLGEDQDVIRIETIAKNKFRTNVIDEKFPRTEKLLIKPFVKQVYQTNYSSNLEDLLGNLVSWKIVKLIETGELHARYSFLNIPKSFTANNALAVVESLINYF